MVEGISDHRREGSATPIPHPSASFADLGKSYNQRFPSDIADDVCPSGYRAQLFVTHFNSGPRWRCARKPGGFSDSSRLEKVGSVWEARRLPSFHGSEKADGA